eukprot:1040126-Prorocentrum_lima.AAC.1
MTSSLVGSEMCIRDRRCPSHLARTAQWAIPVCDPKDDQGVHGTAAIAKAVSYTHLTLPTICSV